MAVKLLCLLMLMGLSPLLLADAQITCKSLYGQNIPIVHRDAASNQMMSNYASDDNVAHWTTQRLVSRTSPVHPNRHTLPIGENFETCSVGLDTSDSETVKQISGGLSKRKTTHLVDTCGGWHDTGGKLKGGGSDIVITSPAGPQITDGTYLTPSRTEPQNLGAYVEKQVKQKGRRLAIARYVRVGRRDCFTQMRQRKGWTGNQGLISGFPRPGILKQQGSSQSSSSRENLSDLPDKISTGLAHYSNPAGKFHRRSTMVSRFGLVDGAIQLGNRPNHGKSIKFERAAYDAADQIYTSGMGSSTATEHTNILPRSYSRTVRNFQDTILKTPQTSKLFRRVLPFPFAISSTFSPPQQPPHNCQAKFGTEIQLVDCERAFLEIQSVAAIGGTRENSPIQFFFSRSHVFAGQESRMPQGASWGTCSLGIDLANHGPDLGRWNAWPSILTGLRVLISQCVNIHGLGGRLIIGGFEYTLANPKLGITSGTCMDPPHPNIYSLGTCIEMQANQRQASSAHQNLQAAVMADARGSFPARRHLQAAGQQGNNAPLRHNPSTQDPRRRSHLSSVPPSRIVVAPSQPLKVVIAPDAQTLVESSETPKNELLSSAASSHLRLESNFAADRTESIPLPLGSANTLDASFSSLTYNPPPHRPLHKRSPVVRGHQTESIPPAGGPAPDSTGDIDFLSSEVLEEETFPQFTETDPSLPQATRSHPQAAHTGPPRTVLRPQSWVEGGAWVQQGHEGGPQGVWLRLDGWWAPIPQPVPWTLDPLVNPLNNADKSTRIRGGSVVPRRGAKTLLSGQWYELAAGVPPAPDKIVYVLPGTPRGPLGDLELREPPMEMEIMRVTRPMRST